MFFLTEPVISQQ